MSRGPLASGGSGSRGGSLVTAVSEGRGVLPSCATGGGVEVDKSYAPCRVYEAFIRRSLFFRTLKLYPK